MLVKMLKTYTLRITIQEGSDEFWESIKGTGCDDVVALVKETLDGVGLAEDTGCHVRLEKFEERGPM